MSKNTIPVTRELSEPVKKSFLVLKKELADPEKLAKLKEEQTGLEKEIKALGDKSEILDKRKRLVDDEIERIEKVESTLRELEEKATEA